MTNDALIRLVGRILVRKRLTISVCESCTAGMLGALLTRIPGSSQYFVGGIIAYSDRVKRIIVGVRAQTLKHFGAVSAESAREMAKVVRRIMKSDISVAITGIAGPGGGSTDKPVGTVYIALAKKRGVVVQKFRLRGRRQTIRQSACKYALELLSRELSNA